MTIRTFTVRLPTIPTDAELDSLFTRCADLCVVSSPRRELAMIIFDRHALTEADAIVSAIRDLDRIGIAAQAVGPDEGRDPTVAAINLALRLRALAPHVDRIAAIRSLISG